MRVDRHARSWHRLWTDASLANAVRCSVYNVVYTHTNIIYCPLSTTIPLQCALPNSSAHSPMARLHPVCNCVPSAGPHPLPTEQPCPSDFIYYLSLLPFQVALRLWVRKTRRCTTFSSAHRVAQGTMPTPRAPDAVPCLFLQWICETNWPLDGPYSLAPAITQGKNVHLPQGYAIVLYYIK